MFLPGSVPYDGSMMMLMATDNYPLTNMHSWPMVLLMGVLFRLGQNISANFGVFLIVAASTVFEVSCYAAVCCIAKRWWKGSLWVQNGLALFFGLFPIFGIFAQAIMKDGPFMAAFTLYMALYIDTCIISRRGTEEKTGKQVLWNLLWILVVGMFVCILRNNGVYLVLLADLLLVVLVCKGMRKFALITLVAATSCYWAYGNVLEPAVGVTDYSSRAMLAVPIQITARYLSVYPDDLTEDEVEVLNTVFYHYDVMGTDYNPENFDYVKVQFRISTESEDLREYLKVVAAMCMRHPRVCLEAALNQSFGYYYPFYNYTGLSTFPVYQESGTGLMDIYDISYVFSGDYRTGLSYYANLWRETPVLSQMISPATPTWVCLFLAAYLIYKRKWVSILPLAAPVLNMAICMVSPVNGYLRYAMPSLACIPLLLMWTILVTREEPNPPESAEAEEELPPQQEALADASTDDK